MEEERKENLKAACSFHLLGVPTGPDLPVHPLLLITEDAGGCVSRK